MSLFGHGEGMAAKKCKCCRELSRASAFSRRQCARMSILNMEGRNDDLHIAYLMNLAEQHRLQVIHRSPKAHRGVQPGIAVRDMQHLCCPTYRASYCSFSETYQACRSWPPRDENTTRTWPCEQLVRLRLVVRVAGLMRMLRS